MRHAPSPQWHRVWRSAERQLPRSGISCCAPASRIGGVSDSSNAPTPILRAFDAREPMISVIAVTLQESPTEAIQESLSMFAASSRRVAEQHNRRTSATMSTIIGSNRPKEPLLCLPAPRIEDWRRGFVHEETVSCRQIRAHTVSDRLQMEAGSACPVTQCRSIQPDALAGVDLGLPVERQVIAELRDDDLSDQRLGRQAAGHHVLGCMRLRHSFRTATAGVFRTTRHKHAQLRWDHVQPLAHILADPRHLAAAARAQRALRLDNPFHPWQMSRQLTAIAIGRTSRIVGFALDDRRGLLLGGIEHALGDLHVLQRQMVLIWPYLLGFRSERLPTH